MCGIPVFSSLIFVVNNNDINVKCMFLAPLQKTDGCGFLMYHECEYTGISMTW